jgi:hypothetical protein
MRNQSNTFDREISEAMHFRRWLDIKSCLKLNTYWTESKRGQKNYNPTQKYRLAWDVMTFNMNLLIKRAGKDATMDETNGLIQVMPICIANLSTRKQTWVGSMYCC